MDGGKADALHDAEHPVEHRLGDHATALGEDEAQEAVDVNRLAVHDVRRRLHLDDLAERVPVVHAAITSFEDGPRG